MLGGDAGVDRLRVPSSTADDVYEVGPNGTRVRIRRGAAQLDAATTEIVDVGLGTGADALSVADLSGTATADVVVDAGASDLKVDRLTLDGTPAADVIRARRSVGVTR